MGDRSVAVQGEGANPPLRMTAQAALLDDGPQIAVVGGQLTLSLALTGCDTGDATSNENNMSYLRSGEVFGTSVCLCNRLKVFIVTMQF